MADFSEYADAADVPVVTVRVGASDDAADARRWRTLCRYATKVYVAAPGPDGMVVRTKVTAAAGWSSEGMRTTLAALMDGTERDAVAADCTCKSRPSPDEMADPYAHGALCPMRKGGR